MRTPPHCSGPSCPLHKINGRKIVLNEPVWLIFYNSQRKSAYICICGFVSAISRLHTRKIHDYKWIYAFINPLFGYVSNLELHWHNQYGITS